MALCNFLLSVCAKIKSNFPKKDNNSKNRFGQHSQVYLKLCAPLLHLVTHVFLLHAVRATCMVVVAKNVTVEYLLFQKVGTGLAILFFG